MDAQERLAALLAGAVTYEQARVALNAAAYDRLVLLGPGLGVPAYKQMIDLIFGPPAGWIGVGRLLAPPGWSVTHFWWNDIEAAAVLTRAEMDPVTKSRQHVEGRAKRPDCALVLAALRAAGGGR